MSVRRPRGAVFEMGLRGTGLEHECQLPSHACSIKNLLRFLPSQPAARPRPDQVAPVFGSIYIGGKADFALPAAVPLATAPGTRPRRRFGAMSSTVSSYSAISA